MNLFLVLNGKKQAKMVEMQMATIGALSVVRITTNKFSNVSISILGNVRRDEDEKKTPRLKAIKNSK